MEQIMLLERIHLAYNLLLEKMNLERMNQKQNPVLERVCSDYFCLISFDYFLSLWRCRFSDLGRVVQSPIKLTQGQRKYFDFSFVTFWLRILFVLFSPSVLSCFNRKLHQTLEVKNIFKQEKIMFQITFKPGLTVFQTTRPWMLQ